jgi:hypothetical protein
MPHLNLTLEERERRTYIENSPEHAMVLLALEGDESARARRSTSWSRK